MKKIRIIMDFIPEHVVARENAIKLYKALREQGYEVELIATGFEKRNSKKVPIIIQIRGDIGEDDLECMRDTIDLSDNNGESDEQGLTLWKNRVLTIIAPFYRAPNYICIEVTEINGRFYSNEQIPKGLYVSSNSFHRYLSWNVFNNKRDEEIGIATLLHPPINSEPLLEPDLQSLEFEKVLHTAIHIVKEGISLEKLELSQELRPDTLQRGISNLNKS